jgi:hypothetical protein
MSVGLVILSLLAGFGAAAAAGAFSGLRIGAQTLGSELAAYMGCLYGLVAGAIAVTAGVLVSQMI